MIVMCSGCETKYMLGDEKVPPGGIRVRCPKCRFVWKLSGMRMPDESVFEVTSSKFASDVPLAESTGGGWNAMQQPAAAVLTQPQVDSAPREVEITYSKPQPAREEIQETPEMKKNRERAKRLARVFVSDLLVYNQEKRDQGLANGDLMTVLGAEIKKAWEAYKEKIGTGVVESSDYFREALNEILADGQKIF